MKIEYLHASKFGNGAMVAAEFARVMAARGVSVEVHHIREVRPARLSAADPYVFSSPGRMSKPIGGMRRFLAKVTLPAGTDYAVLTTEAAAKPDRKTGRVPTEEELTRRSWRGGSGSGRSSTRSFRARAWSRSPRTRSWSLGRKDRWRMAGRRR
jgi:hypothetical protein